MLKRLAIFLLALTTGVATAWLTLTFFAGEKPPAGPPPEKYRILLLGDSTVLGSECRDRYPKADHLEDIVRKLLAAEKDLPPVEVINKGENGDTVRRCLSGRYQKDVADQGPLDYIFVRFGLNDYNTMNAQGTFVSEFPKSYRELVQRLRRDHPGAEIVLETTIPVFGDDGDRTLNDQVRAVAAAEKVPLLDQHGPFAAEMKFGPNALYYRRMAVKDIPEKYLAFIPPEAYDQKREFVVVMDNQLDVHFRDVPSWLSECHPNFAGYHVLGVQVAKYLVPRMRERAKAR